VVGAQCDVVVGVRVPIGGRPRVLPMGLSIINPLKCGVKDRWGLGVEEEGLSGMEGKVGG